MVGKVTGVESVGAVASSSFMGFSSLPDEFGVLVPDFGFFKFFSMFVRGRGGRAVSCSVRCRLDQVPVGVSGQQITIATAVTTINIPGMTNATLHATCALSP